MLAGALNGSFIVRNDLTSEQALIVAYVADRNLIDYKLHNTSVCLNGIFILHFSFCLRTEGNSHGIIDALLPNVNGTGSILRSKNG